MLMMIVQVNAVEICTSIPETIKIVKTQGCASVSLCMGYAECVTSKKKYLGKIICKANKDLSCPEAEECLKSTFENHDINISVQSSNATNGIYKFCNSNDAFKKGADNKVDVVNSRLCNVVSGDYSAKVDDDRVKAVTDTLGKKRVK